MNHFKDRNQKKHLKFLSLWVYGVFLVVFTSCLSVEELASKEQASVPGNGDATVFSYDSASGQCRSLKGQSGLNPTSLGKIVALIKKSLISNRSGPAVYRGVNFECYDLQSLDFSKIVGTGYPSLDGFNFKGANLSGAKLSFINFHGGKFEGAQLKNILMGYTTMTGTADRYTTVPSEGCQILGASLECRK